jgi:hypothetical protein
MLRMIFPLVLPQTAHFSGITNYLRIIFAMKNTIRLPIKAKIKDTNTAAGVVM